MVNGRRVAGHRRRLGTGGRDGKSGTRELRGVAEAEQPGRATIAELCRRGFDARIICTVNKTNRGDCLDLLDLADTLGVSLVKYHVFSAIGSGQDTARWGLAPGEWIDFHDHLERVGPGHRTRIWYQPTYARRERMARHAADGYRGCLGRTLDRISIFPDGRTYVCSVLFDTDPDGSCSGNAATPAGPTGNSAYLRAPGGRRIGNHRRGPGSRGGDRRQPHGRRPAAESPDAPPHEHRSGRAVLRGHRLVR